MLQFWRPVILVPSFFGCFQFDSILLTGMRNDNFVDRRQKLYKNQKNEVAKFMEVSKLKHFPRILLEKLYLYGLREIPSFLVKSFVTESLRYGKQMVGIRKNENNVLEFHRNRV